MIAITSSTQLQGGTLPKASAAAGGVWPGVGVPVLLATLFLPWELPQQRSCQICLCAFGGTFEGHSPYVRVLRAKPAPSSFWKQFMTAIHLCVYFSEHCQVCCHHLTWPWLITYLYYLNPSAKKMTGEWNKMQHYKHAKVRGVKCVIPTAMWWGWRGKPSLRIGLGSATPSNYDTASLCVLGQITYCWSLFLHPFKCVPWHSGNE